VSGGGHLAEPVLVAEHQHVLVGHVDLDRPGRAHAQQLA